MRATRIAFLVAIVAALGSAAVATAGAATPTTITFDSLTGPSTFCAPAAPVTIDDVTVSGGAIMTAVTNLPADQTTVYGTAACPGYSSTITLTFATPVSDVSVDVINGEGATVSYTVADNAGGTVTQTLLPNFSSGSATFTLTGSGITSVTISRTTAAGSWDFFIDNVSFTVAPVAPTFPATTAECKNGAWQTWGIFKNQGDCVSFVVTGGRNQPAG